MTSNFNSCLIKEVIALFSLLNEIKSQSVQHLTLSLQNVFTLYSNKVLENFQTVVNFYFPTCRNKHVKATYSNLHFDWCLLMIYWRTDAYLTSSTFSVISFLYKTTLVTYQIFIMFPNF